MDECIKTKKYKNCEFNDLCEVIHVINEFIHDISEPKEENIPEDAFVIPYIGENPPVQARTGDAGYDLTSLNEVYLPAGKAVVIETGLRLAIPEGYYGRILSRSGLAVHHDIESGAGTIDAGYRGEIKVKLRNFGDNDYLVKKGQKIAQLVIMKHETPVYMEVSELPKSERGEGGFGHTDADQYGNPVEVADYTVIGSRLRLRKINPTLEGEDLSHSYVLSVQEDTALGDLVTVITEAGFIWTYPLEKLQEMAVVVEKDTLYDIDYILEKYHYTQKAA